MYEYEKVPTVSLYLDTPTSKPEMGMIDLLLLPTSITWHLLAAASIYQRFYCRDCHTIAKRLHQARPESGHSSPPHPEPLKLQSLRFPIRKKLPLR
ncbi:hypothetical protein M431DRAFT_226044 [Trichoderma harzianum CBS 226.95]|uniref:Uncharacterized protein n=1 Tax=Trichoderma harzianum CBS 226.95 TaxID=983964 RepID=A0A2T4A3U7_TRIHA|nr:hypothetical protein M431DRAFT_226044 [Trichoderma harzianum CBS 226.95]PTB51729.1 hypothetical protein M431DRAFT_226044 [Trichoderma harzianum CBS 226.95]